MSKIENPEVVALVGQAYMFLNKANNLVAEKSDLEYELETEIKGLEILLESMCQGDFDKNGVLK